MLQRLAEKLRFALNNTWNGKIDAGVHAAALDLIEATKPTYTERQLEALGILQEECAEVIQEISKLRRSGPDFCRKGDNTPNSVHLHQEIMDLRIILEIAQDLGALGTGPTQQEQDEYRIYKMDRLRKWSNLIT